MTNHHLIPIIVVVTVLSIYVTVWLGAALEIARGALPSAVKGLWLLALVAMPVLGLGSWYLLGRRDHRRGAVAALGDRPCAR